MLTIEDILEILATPLSRHHSGEPGVLRASNVGTPVTLNSATSAPARAYNDAPSPDGETVTMQVPAERKGDDRLLGRRAA